MHTARQTASQAASQPMRTASQPARQPARARALLASQPASQRMRTVGQPARSTRYIEWTQLLTLHPNPGIKALTSPALLEWSSEPECPTVRMEPRRRAASWAAPT
eukprot:364690-Chlamydomonas_euryale.AAC.14